MLCYVMLYKNILDATQNIQIKFNI